MLTFCLESSKKLIAEQEGRIVGSFWFSVQDWHFNPRIFFVGFQDIAEDVDRAEVMRELYAAALEVMQPSQPLLLTTEAVIVAEPEKEDPAAAAAMAGAGGTGGMDF